MMLTMSTQLLLVLVLAMRMETAVAPTVPQQQPPPRQPRPLPQPPQPLVQASPSLRTTVASNRYLCRAVRSSLCSLSSLLYQRGCSLI
jgi:hypothetical protein